MHLKDKKISIIGGGLVGSLLSIYLSKIGAKVTVYDKRSDLRKKSNSAGRSINLALSNRGINALEKIGFSKEILDISMPMYKRIMHAKNGDLTYQQYEKKDQAIFSVSRKDLNIKLINIAEKNSVNFMFNRACTNLNVNNNTIFFDEYDNVKSDFIFGADGAGSIVRKIMSKSFSSMNTIEKFIDFGYKELTIPANKNGAHKLDKLALHIWPRKSYMVIALPNLDGTFTCTLFAPLKGKNSFYQLTDEIDVMNFFKENFYDLSLLIPDLSTQYFANPQSSLGYVRCNFWKKNNLMLIGDACHATVPFYGQGMNSGFEDCFLLDKFLLSSGVNDLKFDQFIKERIKDTSAMQDLSMHNFIEMRDKTADNRFLLQKKIEHWFSEQHPNKWTPLYSMVSFSNIRYSEAVSRGNFQHKIMKEIMTKNNLYDKFDIVELKEKNIENQILAKLNDSSISEKGC